MSVSKPGFQGFYFDSMECDRTRSSNVNFWLAPGTLSGYQARTVTLYISELQTNPLVPTQIANGSSFDYEVFTLSGACATGTSKSYTTGGYALTTSLLTPDCFIGVRVRPIGKTPFMTFVRGVDLGHAATVSLAEDPLHTSPVSVTAGAVGNAGSLVFSTPYGYVWGATGDFSVLATTSVPVTNPYGYQGYWSQSYDVDGYPTSDYVKSWMSSGTVGPVGGAATLPALLAGLGPTGAPDPGTIAYSGGTLSIAPVTGATVYMFWLEDEATGTVKARIVSRSSSVALPAWMRAQFSGMSVVVEPYAMDAASGLTDLTSLGQSMSNSGNVPATAIAMVHKTTNPTYAVVGF